MRKTKRAYKYRFYPTDEQRKSLAQTFGCVRFAYNCGLHTRLTAYKDRGEKLFYRHLSALLPELKYLRQARKPKHREQGTLVFLIVF